MIILWTSLGMLISASIFQKKDTGFAMLIGGGGWALFFIHWGFQPQKYLEIQDYYNTGIVILGALISAFIAYLMLRIYVTRKQWNRESRDIHSLLALTRAAAVGGLLYFIFAAIPSMRTWIIGTVTDQTVWLLSMLGVPVEKLDWNLYAVNGFPVEIILACTAIESISLFTGFITSIRPSAGRMLKALAVSLPVIYTLNLIRVVFTSSAYGLEWFGPAKYSFHISEHFITKIGSTIALMVIAYAVFRILPELLDMMIDLKTLVMQELKKSGIWKQG
jgi:archaeosortase A (PGF-CTERM-specific)